MLDTGLVVRCACVLVILVKQVWDIVPAYVYVWGTVLVVVFVGDNVFNDMCERHSDCLDVLKTCT